MTIHLLSSVDKWDDSINTTDITINPYAQLLTHISTMKIVSEQTDMYMKDDDSSILYNVTKSFEIIGYAIGAGVSAGNQLICKDFLNDGVLSKTEISFLTSLKQDLENIKDGLYSKETKRENRNLTMKDFAKVVQPFVNKYNNNNINNIGLGN